MNASFLALFLCLLPCLGRAKPSKEEEYRRARKDGLWDSDCEGAYVALKGKVSQFLDEDVVRPQGSSGIVVSVAGDNEFVEREVVPAAKWFQQLPKARSFGTTVFAEHGLLTSSIRNAFDTCIEVPSTKLSPLAFRVKAFKIKAMARSPYQYTLYLDLDSRPCDYQGHFLDKLWPLLHHADLALADNYAGQAELAGTDADLLREHASGLVVLNSSSLQTRTLLADYAAAHHLLKRTRRGRRDQPALMVALRLAAERQVSLPLRLGHLPENTFCRKNTSEIVSCEAKCLVVHKAARYDLGYKIFGIGFKKTGTTTLAAALRALKIGPEPTHADSVAATIALLQTSASVTPALRAAKHARAMTDAPWCLAASRKNLLLSLAHTYPHAKFVLTKRPTLEWWISTRNWLACLKPFNIDRYARMLNAPNFSRPDFTYAYDRYNQYIIDFFSSSPHRLLIIELGSNSPFPWSELCAFVEAWGKCPIEIDLRRNSFFESDFAISHPKATPSRPELEICSSATLDYDEEIVAHGLRRRNFLLSSASSRNRKYDPQLAALASLRDRRREHRKSIAVQVLNLGSSAAED